MKASVASASSSRASKQQPSRPGRALQRHPCLPRTMDRMGGGLWGARSMPRRGRWGRGPSPLSKSLAWCVVCVGRKSRPRGAAAEADDEYDEVMMPARSFGQAFASLCRPTMSDPRHAHPHDTTTTGRHGRHRAAAGGARAARPRRAMYRRPDWQHGSRGGGDRRRDRSSSRERYHHRARGHEEQRGSSSFLNPQNARRYSYVCWLVRGDGVGGSCPLRVCVMRRPRVRVPLDGSRQGWTCQPRPCSLTAS